MQACKLDVERQYHYRDVFSGWVDLAYDTHPVLFQVLVDWF